MGKFIKGSKGMPRRGEIWEDPQPRGVAYAKVIIKDCYHSRGWTYVSALCMDGDEAHFYLYDFMANYRYIS